MLNFTAYAWPILIGVALKSTLVLGAAWLLTVCLRGASAAARHLVWTAAIAALLALPFLSAGLPAVRISLLNAILGTETGLTFQVNANAPESGVPATAASASVRSLAPSQSPRTQTPAGFNPKSALLLLWLAGIAAGFAQIAVAVLALWRTRRHARPSPDMDLARSLAGSLGIRESVRILESEAAMPMTCGIFRPTIFLPRDARTWRLERRRVVLLHELAHVRRGDAATHLLARTAVALHWWNPLAWTAWRSFIRERERAADDLVLSAGAAPAEYASHLLDIARTLQPVSATAAAALSIARRGELEGRLIAILDSRLPRSQQSRTATCAAAALAIALVAPLAAVHAQSQTDRKALPDVDATILAANARKSHEALDNAAVSYEQLRKFAEAQKLREAALAVAEQTAGSQSGAYVTELVKLGDLAVKRNAIPEATNYYNRALAGGDRPESVPALLFLGRQNLMPTAVFKAGQTEVPAAVFENAATANDYFQRVRNAAQNGNDIGTAMTYQAWMRERRSSSLAGPGDPRIGEPSADSNPSAIESLYRGALAVEDSASEARALTLELFARFLKAQDRTVEAALMQDEAQPIHKARAIAISQALAGSRQVYQAASIDTAPKLIYKVEPDYTAIARATKLSGTVQLSVVVDTDGTVKNVQVIRGLGLGLDEQAVDAIESWRFKPGTQAGTPVAVQATIEVHFKLL
jgi:TonB family protein